MQGAAPGAHVPRPASQVRARFSSGSQTHLREVPLRATVAMAAHCHHGSLREVTGPTASPDPAAAEAPRWGAARRLAEGFSETQG